MGIVPDSNDAGLTEHAIHETILRSHGRCVSYGRVFPRFCRPSFQQDHGLGAGHFSCNLQKTPWMFDAFEIHHDRLRFRIVGQVLKGRTFLDIDLVSETDDSGNTEMLTRQDIQHRMGGKVSRLSNIGDRAAANLAQRERRWR